MRLSDSPFTTDWFVISLRWLALLGLVLSLSLGDQVKALPNLFLAGMVLWNIALTLMAGLNVRMPVHREISLSVDILLAGAYFVLAGGYSSAAFWVVFIPVVTASFFFGLRGSLIAAVLMTAVQIAFTLYQTKTPLALLIMGGSSLLTLLVGTLLGSLSGQLTKILRRSLLSQQNTIQRKSRMDNERLRAIYNLTSTLTGTLNYQRVLETVLDLSLSALNSEADTLADDRLVCAVLLFEKEGALEVGSARRLTPADMRVVIKGQQGALAQAIEQDKPVLVKEVKQDPELNRFIAFQNCRELYCFPMRSGFNAYGVLLFGHTESGFFTTDRREVLDILGRQSVVAIQNARLYQDIVDERERMIEVQEEARKKLARDLHDGPTQSVSAIAMRVNMARRILKKDTKSADDELGRIEELARRTTKEIRHMLFTLRPLVLESQGLLPALQSMAEKMKETYSQNVLVTVDENGVKDLEVGKQGVIFYIVEEAVNNARKHARAEHIWVNLRPFEKEMVLLEIRDDGVGFDVAAVNRAYDQRGSLGMVNLRERTELVNGVLDIKSTPGKGTRVQVYIPLTEESADRLHHAAGKR
jgi:signal transduction histidine kinase